ncbi:MAG TPA: hypothetical protein VHB21_11415 [Minicystis sp.]|nr:hypothetical protein [Minicystis sp.]
MRAEVYDIAVPGTQTTGTPLSCANLRDKYVQVTGIAGGGVLKLEVTIDGSTWVRSGADVNADGIYAIAETAQQIRANRSTLGSGTWTAKLSGFNVRAD